MSTETRRLTLTDAYRDTQERMRELLTKQSEASATVEIETTAKGEPKPRVHLTAPVGADLDALAAHASNLAAIAMTTYFNATPANGTAVEEEIPF